MASESAESGFSVNLMGKMVIHHPRVFVDFGHCWPLGRVYLQHQSDKGTPVGTHFIPHFLPPSKLG